MEKHWNLLFTFLFTNFEKYTNERNIFFTFVEDRIVSNLLRNASKVLQNLQMCLKSLPEMHQFERYLLKMSAQP